MGNIKTVNLNKLAFRSGSSYMVSNIMISAISILTAPIFTRLLTTADYGVASNFAAWVNVGLVIIGLGLPYSIGNAKTDFPSELNKFLASIQLLGTIMAGSVLILAIIFKDSLANWMEVDPSLVVIMFVYLLVFPSVLLAQERYKFLLKYKQNIYISLFGALGAVSFCFLFILVFFKDQRYYGRIIGLIFPFFLMGSFFYIKILVDGWNVDFKKYWSYALKISLPMIPHALAMVVLTQMDRIMIVKICGNADAGLFSFGYSYAVLLLLVSNAVLQAYQPWLYIKYKAMDIQSIGVSTSFIATGMCLLTLVCITVAPEALMVLGAKNFWAAKVVVMPIAIGALFQYIYNTYTTLELFHKKTIVIAIGTIFAAAINYSLNSLLIPVYGFIAAAYATLLSYLSLALFHLIAHKKITKKSIYNDEYIWIIAFTTAVIAYFISQLYETIMLRYIVFLSVILVVFLIALVNKKRIALSYQLMTEKREDTILA